MKKSIFEDNKHFVRREAAFHMFADVFRWWLNLLADHWTALPAASVPLPS